MPRDCYREQGHQRSLTSRVPFWRSRPSLHPFQFQAGLASSRHRYPPVRTIYCKPRVLNAKWEGAQSATPVKFDKVIPNTDETDLRNLPKTDLKGFSPTLVPGIWRHGFRQGSNDVPRASIEDEATANQEDDGDETRFERRTDSRFIVLDIVRHIQRMVRGTWVSYQSN